MNDALMKTKDDMDCRAISKGFLERFSKGKDLYPFVSLVNKHPELEFCLRGNGTPEKVVIYRNNHAMFTITSGTVYFNPNYLRYCGDWDKKLDILYSYGYGKGKRIELGEVKQTTRGYSCSFKESPAFSVAITEQFMNRLDDVYKTISEIFDCYFDDENCKKDCFLESKGYIKLSNHERLEKKRQQQLYKELKNQKAGFFFYDMEFQQKHENQTALKEDINQGINNKPDMQAIRFDKDGNPKAWVSVEVKCTAEAYNGKSGLETHSLKTDNYSRENLEARKREAYLLLHQYKELGFIKLNKALDASKFDQLSYEKLFVFTDEAIGLWKKDPKHKNDHSNDEKYTFVDKVTKEKIDILLCNFVID